MGAITAWVETLEFTAESPDRTVRSRLAGHGPVEVKLSPAAWQRHSETSLAGQVEAAVQDVLVAYQESVDERRYNGRDPVRLAKEGDGFARRQLEFQRAVAGIAVSGSSTARHVDVEWHGMADVRIRIQPGTIARLNRPQLTGEIQSGIAAAGRARSRQVLRLSERIHGPIPQPPYEGDRHE